MPYSFKGKEKTMINLPIKQDPYSDDLMWWDDATQKYYLTEQSLIREGINIRGRLALTKTENATYVINGFLKRVTSVVYGFIHKHNTRNDVQDYFIAVIPSLREKIRLALTYQAMFIWFNGDWTLSPEREKRENAIDPIAIDELNTKVPELNNPITYRGEWVLNV